MEMIVSIASSVIVLIVGAVISFVVNMFKRAVIDKMNELEGKFNSMYEELLRDYVRKDEFNASNGAHEKIWTEVNGLRERVARLEK
jgi:BMFP domain-containing protein YqiC